MAYFDDVKVKDRLYGIIFGAGKVSQVFENSHYKMMVTFKDGYEVPYTEDGIPGWGKFKEQTIYYKSDIDLTDIDFTPVTKVLSPKKIIKLREKKKLEIKLPSGIWINCKKCVKNYMEEMLEKENYHLFRKTLK
ncbi:hypothetical protein HUE87_09120 [Candidatus Sulfurimonas marisnigri]|uniref:Uncharacterized protein n=1 Tax=Candidatus Sulfurimonas marisnigri TaxID=2740405 RepID=A0A7S7RPW0_9BACT|nr:hypothetical protein [Candidatus Sulfurimonas marisnigri]QOY54041.1 hypothetical protein HUE87_09120 [Candidatus Sulfurimonas marisnigri]